VKRIAAGLLAVLAACSSKPPDPRLNVAAETPPLASETAAHVMVDSLKDEQTSLWADSVEDLEPGLRTAVHLELSRRAVEVSEKDPPDQREAAHKEVQAIRLILVRSPNAAGDFADFVVWTSAHKGAEGEKALRALGIGAFPAVLKLRRDRHPEVTQGIAVILSQRLIGGRASRVTTDEQIITFCKDELTRCPEDCRPSYRAILATLGDDTALDAFPALLKSEVLADQILAHLLLYGVISKGNPYDETEMRALLSTAGKKVDLWQAQSRRILGWWEKNLDRLVFDAKTGFWNVK
jgi:hypothetical protein